MFYELLLALGVHNSQLVMRIAVDVVVITGVVKTIFPDPIVQKICDAILVVGAALGIVSQGAKPANGSAAPPIPKAAWILVILAALLFFSPRAHAQAFDPHASFAIVGGTGKTTQGDPRSALGAEVDLNLFHVLAGEGTLLDFGLAFDVLAAPSTGVYSAAGGFTVATYGSVVFFQDLTAGGWGPATRGGLILLRVPLPDFGQHSAAAVTTYRAKLAPSHTHAFQ